MSEDLIERLRARGKVKDFQPGLPVCIEAAAEIVRLRAKLAEAEAEEPCPVCAKPFAAGDTCATDIELGKCHAECLSGSPTVDLETGEPVAGPIDSFPHAPPPKAEAVERAAKAIHDGPLGANDEEDFGDNKASDWCREVARAALLAAFPSKEGGQP